MKRLDSIGFNDIKILQDSEGFSYGVDAVLLSNFINTNTKGKGKRIVDLGTNNGIIPLILSTYEKEYEILGVEVNSKSSNLAIENVKLNNLEDRINILNLDIIDIFTKLEKDSFDIVCSNPPYFEKGKGFENIKDDKKLARIETTAKLEDFIEISSKLLKANGELFLIHRPSRLVDLISLGRKYKMEPKVLRMVVPDKNMAPTMVLIKYVKGGNKELKVLPDLLIREDGKYSKELLKIYGREE